MKKFFIFHPLVFCSTSLGDLFATVFSNPTWVFQVLLLHLISIDSLCSVCFLKNKLFYSCFMNVVYSPVSLRRLIIVFLWLCFIFFLHSLCFFWLFVLSHSRDFPHTLMINLTLDTKKRDWKLYTCGWAFWLWASSQNGLLGFVFFGGGIISLISLDFYSKFSKAKSSISCQSSVAQTSMCIQFTQGIVEMQILIQEVLGTAEILCLVSNCCHFLWMHLF